MNFDPTYLPYPSKRYPLYARKGMVATSSNLAASAGLQALEKGGNAVDAAIAAAAALTVVEPAANGIGGDAFALVWTKGKLYGLNASGFAPKNLTAQRVLGKHPGAKTVPTYGWTPVMTPGAPKAWAALSERFGRLPLREAMAPAVGYAREGYPVPANLAPLWKRAAEKYRANCKGGEFEEWFRTFTKEGRTPQAGELVRLPHHADTLEAIAESGAREFYEGAIAGKIDRDSRAFGGFLRKEDLAAYDVEWVEPLSVHYRGYDLWELPPNGQGLAALIALNILKEFSFPEKECALTVHRQLEAMKLAFSDTLRHVTDPRRMQVDPRDFLRPEYGARKAALITDKALLPDIPSPPSGGTVYLCTADGEGNMVSFIQSNYMGFGSGIVVRDTGIALQNRGRDFSLNPAHANYLEPGKRCYHTIIPAFLTKDGQAVGPLGVMGGYMQPQGHVQVVMNLIDFGLGPQQALDAPRWQWIQGREVAVENFFSPEIGRQLAAMGHQIRMELDSTSFGRGQVILRRENGVLVGGTEPRTDSSIACW